MRAEPATLTPALSQREREGQTTCLLSTEPSRKALTDPSGQVGIKPYFLVSAHREENIDLPGRFEKLGEVLNQLAARYNWPVIVTTHPRTRKRMEASGITFSPLVQFHKPFGLSDYLALQLSAQAVLSDSGTVTEEASILNLRALNLRDAHERPEGMEEGTVIMTGLDWPVVQAALDQILPPNAVNRKIVADYDVDNVSDKVLCILLSYIPYVRRVVWREQ